MGEERETDRLVIGVMGAAKCDSEIAALAERVGALIAQRGAVLLTGGRGGVMEAAARGARSAGGLTVGVLKGEDRTDRPNAHTDIAIRTGMGDARNWINVCTAVGVIAIAGGWGTLSEIALAAKIGKPVVLLRSWALSADGVEPLPTVDDAESAVDLLFGMIA